MKLSRKFVSDYIDIPTDTKTLADDMTRVGNEYNNLSKLITGTNLIIGKVIKCENHPNSDHLHVCMVDIGKEILTIVCGAPNVREGINVIVAQNGAELIGGKIKKSIIRGIESNGMICSLNELGLDNKYISEDEKNGIHILSNNAKIGEEPIKYEQFDDEIIDFELTANRGDLLSILGMAYEIGAIYNTKIKNIDTTYNQINESIKNNFDLSIETNDCPIFLVKKVTNITINESPEIIKNRLIASGIRPINNIVDISNYVMLETGQPLHFYDADKLGNQIIVRNAKENEQLKTIDGIIRKLDPEDIVIANKKNTVGLAGVMGGFETEIDINTKNIIIESAIFDSYKVRKTSNKFLRSEASIRFEKGLDANRTYLAIERACHLLEKYANGKINSDIIAHDITIKEDKQINITFKKINETLGLEINDKSIIDVFERLGFKVKNNNGNMTVSVPQRRIDINMECDLIEEVGRIYGVDNIVGKLPKLNIIPGYINKKIRNIKEKLASLGLNETLTYSLESFENNHKWTNDKYDEIKILDPMTEEKTTLRYSLIPSLYKVYKYNTARNIKDVCIFEIGHSFYKKDNDYLEKNTLSILMTGLYYDSLEYKKNVDFYIAKMIIEELLNYLGYNNRYEIKASNTIPKEFHPYQSAEIIVNKKSIGNIGRIIPSLEPNEVYVIEIDLDSLFDFKTSQIKYKEINKYPSISKDIAFILDKNITANIIIDTIKTIGGKLLTNIKIFDIYTGTKIGESSKSIAFNLLFENYDKTLTDEEVNILLDKIILEISKKYNGKLRNN